MKPVLVSLCLTMLTVAAAPALAVQPRPVAAKEPPRASASADSASADRPAGGEVRASQRPATPPGPFPLPADLPAKARFVVIELSGEVNLGMAAFVDRVAGNLQRGDILVLDINTFGGRVDAAVTIRDALLHTRDVGAFTVAWVNPRAISAGALISLATDAIVVAPAATIGAATPVQMGQGGGMEAVEEKVVSYMRQEMRATAEARGRNGDIAAAMVDPDIEIDGLDDRGKTLTLDGKSALAWSIASFEANRVDGVLRGLGYGEGARPYELVRVEWSWAEKLAGWLSGSVLSGLLMTIGMLGIMIGLYSGGAPLPLGLGAVCLGLFFFGHHIVNLAGIEDMLLFILGLVLIAIEVIVPGYVLPGVLGVLCVIAALFLGLVDFDKVDFEVQWKAGYVTRALSIVFGSILATATMMYAAFKVLPESRLGRHLLLTTRIEGRATDSAAQAALGLVGQVGTVVSALRPSGKVKIGELRYDAVAERGYIDAGTPVEVIKREGFSLVVAPVREPKA
jgi:membrane-bound serine protease (ClpP class)